MEIAAALRAELLKNHPASGATILDRSVAEDAAGVVRSESPAVVAPVIAMMAPLAAARVIAELDDSEFAAIAGAMEIDALVRLLAALEDSERERRLAALTPAIGDEVRLILRYPPTQAGSMMDTRFVRLSPAATADEALVAVRARAGRTRDVFVVGPDGRVTGAVLVEEVALARPAARLDSLALYVPPTIEATAPTEEVRDRLRELGAHSLPVVDFEGRMIGVIRAPELVEAAERLATADMQKMVGAGSEERALSSPRLAVTKRLPWLYINLVTAFIAAGVVGVFEDTIAQFTALAVLLPVVAGQSGNSGSQALAVSMRGLALREFRSAQWRRVALKEASVGIVNGVAIALVTAIGVFIWAQSIGLSVVIGVAMVIAMTVAGLAGAVIPIILRALGQDPAQSSSIVLTTVTDVVGFTSFLGLATLLARYI